MFKVTGDRPATPPTASDTRGDELAERAAVASQPVPTSTLAGYAQQPDAYKPPILECPNAPARPAPRQVPQHDLEMRAMQRTLETGIGLQGSHFERGYGVTPDAPRAPRIKAERIDLGTPLVFNLDAALDFQGHRHADTEELFIRPEIPAVDADLSPNTPMFHVDVNMEHRGIW